MCMMTARKDSISIHTLTLRVTGPALDAMRLLNHFNPHPHTEGDSYKAFRFYDGGYISIHTLTLRVTRDRRCKSCLLGISIHTLTLRVTLEKLAEALPEAISIHTLTLRVTVLAASLFRQLHNFNPHPHTEGDSGNISYYPCPNQFQSTPSH